MLYQYRDIKAGEFFVIGGDVSAGCNDNSVCQFMSVSRLDVPLVYVSCCTGNTMTTDIYPILNKIFDVTGIKPTVAYERNNGGASDLERLRDLNRDGKYDIFVMPKLGVRETGDTGKIGWCENSESRPHMLKNLKETIDNKLLKIYRKETITELFSFIVSNRNKAEAEKNSHDDEVMALGIANIMRIKLPVKTSIKHDYSQRQFPAVMARLNRLQGGSSSGYWPR